MALVINATAGSSTANAYCTQAEATTYHDAHLYSSVWTAATSASKDKAIAMATRIMDEQMNWMGWKSDSAQALMWPRTGIYDRNGDMVDGTTIPQFLKNATAEFARLLLVGDRTAENSMKGFKSLKVDTIEMVADKADSAPVMPPSVWAMIRFYGTKISQTRLLVRV